MPQKTAVAIVFGGRSPEHPISCLTAISVLSEIPEKYTPVLVGITRAGHFVRLDEADLMAMAEDALPEVPSDRPGVLWQATDEGVFVVTLDSDTVASKVHVDVAFALLHGPYGEDGTIQGMFEMLGLPYVGSRVAASANSMDKHLTKAVLAQLDIPNMPHVLVTADDWQDAPEKVRRQVEELGFPVFVKPCRAGSSIGVSKVDSIEGLDAALETAHKYDPRTIVELGALNVQEVECGVLSDGDIRVSVPGEIKVTGGHDFYNFEAKYTPNQGVELEIPAKLPEHVVSRLREVAVQAVRALGIEGIARVDSFVTADGEVWLNEVNTMPGFTKFSM
ncbi:MAG: D-alanine--D-alanine ligase A, partial [Propionibacterium sp.]